MTPEEKRLVRAIAATVDYLGTLALNNIQAGDASGFARYTTGSELERRLRWLRESVATFDDPRKDDATRARVMAAAKRLEEGR